MDNKQAEKDNKLLNALFDPESIKDSVAFNATMSILQIVGLIAFSFLSATMQFGFDNWLDVVYSKTYWLNIVFMTAEQFYAYNIAYTFAISLLMNAPKYVEVIQQGDDIINGVWDEENQKWLTVGIKEDAPYVDIACDEINASERLECFTKQIISKMTAIKSKCKRIELKPIPRLFKKWRISKRKRRIESFNQSIAFLNFKLNDMDYYNSLTDKQIKGYKPIDQASINTNQIERPEGVVSKYGMVDRKKLERKGAVKRIGVKILTALALPLAAWGAVTLKSGAIVSIIVMLILQFVSGWNAAAKNFKKADVFNADQRFKTLKEIKRRVPGIKEREAAQAKLKAEIEKAEIQAWEDNKKFDAELLAKKQAEAKDLKTERPATLNLQLSTP